MSLEIAVKYKSEGIVVVLIVLGCSMHELHLFVTKLERILKLLKLNSLLGYNRNDK